MSRSLCEPAKFIADNYRALVLCRAVKTVAPAIETADDQQQEHTDKNKDSRNGGDAGVHFISDIFKHFLGRVVRRYPPMKAAITTSSKLRMNAKRAPVITPGLIPPWSTMSCFNSASSIMYRGFKSAQNFSCKRFGFCHVFFIGVSSHLFKHILPCLV